MSMAVTMDWILEIHHIDVGGGDATAIVVKSSDEKIVSRVLIDAGAEGGGAQSLSTYVGKYLQVDDKNPFDYVIVSHYHNDHIDGIWQCKIPFKNYVDAGGYTSGDDKFTPINGIGVKTSAGYFEGYKKQIAANREVNKAKRIPIPFIDQNAPINEPVTIELGVGTGIKLICYCANGVLADGTNVLAGQKTTKRRAFNPNDLSLVIMLEWEDFRYFTAGDLSGDKSLKSYYNVEESLIAYLKKLDKLPVTVLKVTHHGSEYSSYPPSDTTTKNGFLDELQPDALIIPCNISKQVPSPSFLERANSYCATNKTPLLFVNDLFYYKGDGQYAEILDIQSNTEFSNNVTLKDETTATNDAQAVVIRRRSMGKLEEQPKESSDTYIARKKYTAIIKNGKLAREKGFITKPPKFDFGASFLKGLFEAFIIPGFMTQANAINGWLQQDQAKSLKEGISYIEENYPAFVTIINQKPDNLVAALIQELEDLFLELFQDQTINNMEYYSPSNPHFSELSFEQKETLFASLKNNKYQAELNYFIKQKDTNFTQTKLQKLREEAWNYKGEPYTSSGVEKRTAELILPERDPKK
jgi:hypothetical protein